jgi:hypothetical protein
VACHRSAEMLAGTLDLLVAPTTDELVDVGGHDESLGEEE